MTSLVVCQSLTKKKTTGFFAGADFFKFVTKDEESMFLIDGTYEYAIEKINMLVEKYINRFFEK